MSSRFRAGGLAFFTVWALVLGVPAHAGTLTSGVVAGRGNAGVDQMVRCFVTNVGKKSVQVSAAAIREISNGDSVALSFDSCDSDLAPGRTCQFAIDPPSFSGWGEVTVKGSTKSLRGRCQVFTTDDELVRSESEMR